MFWINFIAVGTSAVVNGHFLGPNTLVCLTGVMLVTLFLALSYSPL